MGNFRAIEQGPLNPEEKDFPEIVISEARQKEINDHAL